MGISTCFYYVNVNKFRVGGVVDLKPLLLLRNGDQPLIFWNSSFSFG